MDQMRTKLEGISIEDIYEKYVDKYGAIDKKSFKRICYSINKAIARNIIDGNSVKLPGLSFIGIRKKKMQFSKLHFDFAEFNKTGIKSYHLNPHSDEFYAMTYWNKSKAIVKNKVGYSFELTRENKRSIAKVMQTKNGHHLYEMLD
jgi:hypothetical protein